MLSHMHGSIRTANGNMSHLSHTAHYSFPSISAKTHTHTTHRTKSKFISCVRRETSEKNIKLPHQFYGRYIRAKKTIFPFRICMKLEFCTRLQDVILLHGYMLRNLRNITSKTLHTTYKCVVLVIILILFSTDNGKDVPISI